MNRLEECSDDILSKKNKHIVSRSVNSENLEFKYTHCGKRHGYNVLISSLLHRTMKHKIKL